MYTCEVVIKCTHYSASINFSLNKVKSFLQQGQIYKRETDREFMLKKKDNLLAFFVQIYCSEILLRNSLVYNNIFRVNFFISLSRLNLID